MQARLPQRPRNQAATEVPLAAVRPLEVALTTVPPERDPVPLADDNTHARAAASDEPAREPQRVGYSIGRLSILPPRAASGTLSIRRAPDPAATSPTSDDGPSPLAGDSAVPLDAAKVPPGSTTIQEPTMQSTTLHGTTLAAVAAAIPDEAGSVEFDFSVATQGDPATAATLTVTQTMTLPRWAERDTAPAPAQRAWDRFLDALTQHENGHVAIDKRLFTNAHGRFVGLPASQVDPTSDRLRAAVQAQQEAFDARTDHGRTGNPPTILDTTAGAPTPAPPPATSAEQPTSDLDPAVAPDAGPPSLQAQLIIGPEDDPYEREANAVAARVLQLDRDERAATPTLGRAQGRVQRMCAQCAKAIEEGEGDRCPDCAAKADRAGTDRLVSRKGADVGPTSAPQHAPDAVTAALDTGGEPLDRAARADMEGRFGHDFSRVRVHADAYAATSARAINALAYTAGEQIVFGAGRYAPHTESGRWLLAHELTHVIQQRGDVVAPLRAGALAIQRDEDKKEDFDTEQRRLIRDAKTVGDVKDINPQAFRLASDDDRFRLIGLLLNQGWVGPRDEYYLEHIWGSFGKNLPDAARRGLALWNLCIEGGAELWNLAELGPLKDKFKAEVAAKTREYLAKNRAFVQQEQQKLGLDKPQAPATADQNTALAALKEAAKQVDELDHKQAALIHLKVGYNPIPNIGDSSVDMRPEKDRWTPVEFAPDAPAAQRSGPIGIESGPMPTWEATNAEYRRHEAAIKGFAKKHPSIYALRQDNAIGTVASGTDDAKIRQTVATSLQGVLDHIATTEGKLADPKSTLPLDLHPIHEQLYAAPGSPWQDPFHQGVAKQAIKGHEDARWWEELGVNALQLALFAVAELATGGAAVFFLALGAGVGVVRAEQSWESWQEKNAAAKSGMSEETKLLESGEADAALITALLDTATAFLDLYGAGSAALREAQGVKALEERLAAAEAKETKVAAGANNGSGGAMRRRTYEPGAANASKSGLRAPSQAVGQEALDNSVLVGSDLGKTRRVGVNHDTREFVAFHETENESRVFEGVTRKWDELPKEAQNDLISSGVVTREGAIIGNASHAERQARFNNFRQPVEAGELRGAPPAEGSNTPGHALSKHGKEGMTTDVQATVLNQPDHIYSGINENGREVDIYCKRTTVTQDGKAIQFDVAVITEAGNKQSVITAYEKSPAGWAKKPSYVDVNVGGNNNIGYHTSQDWQADFWPDWRARPTDTASPPR